VGAKVVKGIPPFAELLHSDDPTLGGKPAGVFLCGDDHDAKAAVGRLLDALPADVVDVGPLVNARFVEPAAMLAGKQSSAHLVAGGGTRRIDGKGLFIEATLFADATNDLKISREVTAAQAIRLAIQPRYGC
jgi:hypothetical protein